MANALKQHEKRNRLTERKRESHEYRYPSKTHGYARLYKKLDDRINRHRYSDSPSMGRSDVSELQNKQEFRANYPTESSYPRTQGKRGERAVSGLYRQEEPQATMRISEQGSRDLEERQSYGSDGVLSDDRIRKAIARSTGTDAGTAKKKKKLYGRCSRIHSKKIRLSGKPSRAYWTIFPKQIRNKRKTGAT